VVAVETITTGNLAVQGMNEMRARSEKVRSSRAEKSSHRHHYRVHYPRERGKEKTMNQEVTQDTARGTTCSLRARETLENIVEERKNKKSHEASQDHGGNRDTGGKERGIVALRRCGNEKSRLVEETK
jgi:hypothetical protein